MKFKEYDTVRALIDCDKGIKRGEIGAIIMKLEEPIEAYEVEFLDADGYFKAQCTLLPEEIEKANI